MIDNIATQNNQNCDVLVSVDPYPKFGFVVDDLEHINSRYKCIFCSLIIKDPIQLSECGHRSCRECFEVRATATEAGNVTCPCEDCHLVTNKNDIMNDRAFKKELNVLKINCMYRTEKQCPWAGYLAEYQLHLDQNHIYFICPECNKQFPSKVALQEHVTKTCRMIFQSCTLGQLCTKELIRKTELRQHLLSKEHQETVNKFLLGEYHISEMSNPESEPGSDMTSKEFEEKTTEKINNLSKGTQELRDATLQLNEDFTNLNVRLNSLVQDFNNLHASFIERKPIKQSIQPFQDKLQKSIEESERLCNNREHISADGTLTWRVDNVSEKIADAQSERRTSIYSPIFYSSSTGYKMRVRLFLFGDGSARRTHMSLFFSIMKGEYDAILPWPFHYKVTFCLLDQTGNNRHIIDSFFPDIKSNSFQRPKEAANIASGIPKFFPLPMLLQDDNQYVREDTLYIKIIIALDEKPKLILPFVLTLNPALPLHVQENMINQEIAKQSQ